ncbi:hypothetical protein EF910_17450 [Streptomyces sp. WAC07149]|uniref:hypothetical protein n=1 Tax=Streptomyces sp. WAC07149 TaxID=2487425 RepID=UPI000F7989C6|nr:hypothetical protein [Streptomyces sp. WAC07149]RST04332.1 hypothetical protein EF910_17450 [Streptomyces sp. WAC07149]
MGRRQRSAAGLSRAEAVIIERYPQLLRLAYLVLPQELDRHARLLRAHRGVQHSLRAAGRRARQGGDPLAAVRAEVVRYAAGRGLRGPLLPWVWGLRMWPSAEELDEAARALAGLSPYARAAHVLCRFDGLDEEAAEGVLAQAGAGDPGGEVRAGLAAGDADEAEAAEGAEAGRHEGTGAGGRPRPRPRPGRETILHPADVHTRPTDLLLRRTRVRAAWGVAAVLLLAAGLTRATVTGPGGGLPVGYAGAPAARAALDPARLVRVPARAWSDTGRVDFTAWPARGPRTGDRALLARALGTWAAPPSGTAVTVAPAASAEPPGHPPQLLFAGDPRPGTAVVVFLDADRVVRYTERGDRRSLDIARTDDANVTTAAAVTLTRDGNTAHRLLAPWIATAGTRDLTAPARPVRPLPIGADGTVTTAFPDDSGGGGGPKGAGCGPRPVLEVASSPRIVEKHAFLLADRGGLLTVHLTYTPPAEGADAPPARQPREATGPAALARWAQEACTLDAVDGRAVRAVNLWDFALTELPEAAGRAVWSCTRATHWTGQGDVQIRLRPPAGASLAVTRARSTAACGRFGQHLLATTVWRAPSGHDYQLAAGSREVTEISATGPLHTRTPGRALAVPAPSAPAPPATLTATLRSGAVITALDSRDGGRD